jgi:phage recombination protein Bet
LLNGDGNLTDAEIMKFIALCSFQNLNPFLREAYLVKYGNQAAQMITGKETFLKRAAKHPKYQGHKTGIDINDGEMKAWAEVFVEGYTVPIRCEVDYIEYVGKNKDGSTNKIWKEKPKTMLKKVALCQALREAFPDDFGGMYSPEEINTLDMETLPAANVNILDNEDTGNK